MFGTTSGIRFYMNSESAALGGKLRRACNNKTNQGVNAPIYISQPKETKDARESKRVLVLMSTDVKAPRRAINWGLLA